MWLRVLMKIKIVFMLINPPLISIFQEVFILVMDVIKDGSQGVSKFP